MKPGELKALVTELRQAGARGVKLALSESGGDVLLFEASFSPVLPDVPRASTPAPPENAEPNRKPPRAGTAHLGG